jgi:hypothetical protein
VPTFEIEPGCWNDYHGLTREERVQFRKARLEFIADCDSGEFRASLHVHKIDSLGVWSMAWAGDGRALFDYGTERKKGKRHIIWIAIGPHRVYKG